MLQSWLTKLVGKAESEGLANDTTTNGLDLEKAPTTGDAPFNAEELTGKLMAAKLEDRE
jgi:hypothetical protein